MSSAENATDIGGENEPLRRGTWRDSWRLGTSKTKPKSKSKTKSSDSNWRYYVANKWFIGTTVALLLVIILALILGLTLRSHPSQEPVDLPPLDWHQNGTMYRIYVPSFGDSDGDGLGDFEGIIGHLNYLKDLGVNIVWLSPIQDTNTVGNDVTDFVRAKDEYGLLENFAMLLNATKSLGMKVIMDIIINHSSSAHPWFQSSKKNIDPYSNYYIWSQGQKEDQDPPNNWVSLYNGSAWTLNMDRHEYYLHQFRKNEPDLNFRNPQVIAEMKQIVRFWLDHGVDGFYIRDVPLLYEDQQLKDESSNAYSSDPGQLPTDYVSLNHNNTRDLSESYQCIQDIFLSTISGYTGNNTIILMTDYTEKLASEDKWLQMYHLIVSHSLYNLQPKFDGEQLKSAVEKSLDVHNRTQIWSNWALGNEESSRIASKFGRSAPGLQIIQILLPGVKSIYYGEEIEMIDNPSISFDDTRDNVAKDAGPSNYSLVSRDPFRTPMAWNMSRNAGFSSATKPWLPMSTVGLNADSQQKRLSSLWNSIASLNRLKNSSIALTYGSIDFPHVDTNVFSFTRMHTGDPLGYLVIWNLGTRTEKISFADVKYMSDDLQVIRKIKPDSSITDQFTVKKSDVSIDKEELWIVSYKKQN